MKIKMRYEDAYQTREVETMELERWLNIAISEEESQIKFERIRRITGYLVGTVDRFNNGKRAEEHDRVKHMSV